MVERLRELAQHASVGDLLEAVLQETGYLEYLEAERTIEAQGRLENLHELIGVAREFDDNWEGEHGLAGLSEFLQQLSLYSEQDALADREEQVTLMTLHNAKGLEYPVVFMIGCEEGVFPHSRSIDEGNLEEERRLCYVGITRAQGAPLHDLRAHPVAVRHPLVQHALALPGRAPARADRRPGGRARRRLGRGEAAGRAARRCPSTSATTSSTPPSERAS